MWYKIQKKNTHIISIRESKYEKYHRKLIKLDHVLKKNWEWLSWTKLFLNTTNCDYNNVGSPKN